MARGGDHGTHGDCVDHASAGGRASGLSAVRPTITQQDGRLPVRVVLVNDEQIIVDGLRTMLARHREVKVVGVTAVKPVSGKNAEHVRVRILTDVFRHVQESLLSCAAPLIVDPKILQAYALNRMPRYAGDGTRPLGIVGDQVAHDHVAQASRRRRCQVPTTIPQTKEDRTARARHRDIVDSHAVDVGPVDRQEGNARVGRSHPRAEAGYPGKRISAQAPGRWIGRRMSAE